VLSECNVQKIGIWRAINITWYPLKLKSKIKLKTRPWARILTLAWYRRPHLSIWLYRHRLNAISLNSIERKFRRKSSKIYYYLLTHRANSISYLRMQYLIILSIENELTNGLGTATLCMRLSDGHWACVLEETAPHSRSTDTTLQHMSDVIWLIADVV